jgi:FkbM family methyltransferase
VVAVEPQPNCVEYLRARYGRDRRVTIIDRGLDAQEGERQMTISSADSRMSSMSAEWIDTMRTRTSLDLSRQWDTTTTVAVTTLDRLIETYGRPAFCKIDVEGFEYQVFSGLTAPLPAVSFEFHRIYARSARRCIEYLLSLGSYQFTLCAAETFAFSLPEWISGQQMIAQLEQISSAFPDSGDIYARHV